MKNFVTQIKLVLQDQFSSGMQTARSSVKGIGESMQSLQSNSGLLQTASSLGLMAASTEQYRQKLVASLAEPSQKAGELEAALAAVTTVLNADNTIDGSMSKTYGILRDQALAWASGHADGSKIASTSASEYAATTYSMISAGLKADAAISATSKSLILAKGTMGDNKVAADLLAISYNTMGDKSADVDSEMTRLSDTIAKTQATFQISNLGQLNEGLKYGIPVAQKYGIAWNELNTVIGQLNTSGLQGGLAGTSLSGMMAQMNKASNQLGFKIAYDESGGTSVIGTLENIQAKFGDVTKLSPQVQMAFDQAFGIEGGRALTLLSASLGDLKKNYAAIADSDGQSEMMASRMSDSFVEQTARMENARASLQAQMGSSTNKIKGRLMDVQSAWYNMASSVISSPIGGHLSSIVSGGTMAASGLLKVGGTALNTTAQIATIAAMAGKTGGMLNLLKNSATLLGSPLVAIGHGFAGMGKMAIGALPKMGAWIASTWSAASAQMALLWPIVLIIAAVAAVAVGIYMLIKHWDAVKSVAVNTWTSIQEAWGSVGQWFGGIWTSVKDGAGLAFDWIVGKVLAVVDAIKKPFSWIKDKVGGLFGQEEAPLVAEPIAQPAGTQAVAEPIAQTKPINKAVNWVKDKVGGLFGQEEAPLVAEPVAAEPITQPKPINKAMDWIKGKASGLFGKDEGTAAMDTMAAGITGSAPALANATASAFDSTASYLPHSDADRGPFSRLSAAGRAIPTTLASGVSQAGSLLQGATAKVFTKAKDVVSSLPLVGGLFDKLNLDNVLQFPSVPTGQGNEVEGVQNGGLIESIVKRIVGKTAPAEKHYHIDIKQISLPDVKDLQGVIRFVSSLEDQFERASEEMVI